jgi:hypothetical protein
MSMDDETEQWLRALSLDEPAEIDGERIYLKVGQGGAELGGYLFRAYTRVQLQQALRQGFRSAMKFDAGLGVTTDGSDLVLTQWLVNASSWLDAAEPMEKLLNQLSTWRAALEPAKPAVMDTAAKRHEQSLRMLFKGAKK